jgi:hypothetical protein
MMKVKPASQTAAANVDTDPFICGYLRALERQVMAAQLRKPAAK